MKWLVVVPLIFVVSFIAQVWLWHEAGFVDEEVWQQRIVLLTQQLQTWQLDPLNRGYSGHPGMPIMVVGSVLYALGMSASLSLVISVALLIALIATTAWLLSHWLYPALPAHWVVLSLLIFHPLYLQATPTNAVMAAWLVGLLFIVATLQRELTLPRWLYPLLGVWLGLDTITRIPEAPVIAGLLLLWLAYRRGWQPAVRVGGVALLSAYLSNPLLWLTPLQHLQYIFFRSGLNYTHAIDAASLDLMTFLRVSPLALVTVMIIGSALVWPHRVPAPLPRSLLSGILLVALLFSVMYLSVRNQSIRHFLPLIFLGETLFMLFVLHWLQHISFTFVANQQRAQHIALYSVAALLILSPVIILLYSLLLPSILFIADAHA